MKDYPWLQSQEESLNETWDRQYRTDPYGRLKPEEVFIVVPTSRLEEAQKIILPIQENMQLPIYWEFQHNPLCLFSRFIKPSSPNASKLLGQAYIPHCIINIGQQMEIVKSGVLIRAHCDIYYWSNDSQFMLHKWMVIDTREGIKAEFNMLDNYLHRFNWKRISDQALEIKTLILLKGNSDGLPKTHVES